jgi:hypothetical protein
MDETIAALMDRIEAGAWEIARVPARGRGQERVWRFMADVHRLGLRVHREPGLLASPEVRGPLRASVLPLKTQIHELRIWVNYLEDSFIGTWESNWTRVCEARSSLQFFFDVYRETGLADEFFALSPEELDYHMRIVAPYEGGLPASSIPPGMPASHWWWWAPDPPPSGAAREAGATPG